MCINQHEAAKWFQAGLCTCAFRPDAVIAARRDKAVDSVRSVEWRTKLRVVIFLMATEGTSGGLLQGVVLFSFGYVHVFSFLLNLQIATT